MSPRIVSLAALVFLAPGLGAAEESDRPADLQPIAPIGQMRVTNFRNYGGGMEFTFALSPDGKTLAMGSQLPRAARGDGRFRADGTVRAMSRIDRGNGPCQRNTSWKSQTCPIRSFSPHHRRSDGPRAPQCQSAYLNSPRTLRSTVEVDRTGIPFIDELLVEPLSIADGQFAPGSKPGLGVELNAAVVEGLRLDDGALRWRFRLVSALSFAGTSGLWVFFGMPGVRFLLAGGTAIIGTAGLQRTPSGPPVALSPAETLLGGLPGLGTDQVSLQAGAQDDQERFCGQRYSDVPPGKSGMSVEALVAQEHAFSFWVWPSCLGRSASIPERACRMPVRVLGPARARPSLGGRPVETELGCRSCPNVSRLSGRIACPSTGVLSPSSSTPLFLPVKANPCRHQLPFRLPDLSWRHRSSLPPIGRAR